MNLKVLKMTPKHRKQNNSKSGTMKKLNKRVFKLEKKTKQESKLLKNDSVQFGPKRKRGRPRKTRIKIDKIEQSHTNEDDVELELQPHSIQDKQVFDFFIYL